jgi:uncharacterized protein
MMAPLSVEETYELEQFLMSDLTSDETLMLDSLDGYLTAIAIGPTNLELDDWLAGIWGPQEDDAPNFETREQAQHILGLILRYYNGIILRLNDPDAFEPMFDKVAYRSDTREYIEGEPWALGFIDGVSLCRQNWQPLFNDAQGQEWVRPLHLLGADNLTPEEEALTRWPQQREELAKQIPASIAAISRYWAKGTVKPPTQLASASPRSARKPARNDVRSQGSEIDRLRSGILETLTIITGQTKKAFKMNVGVRKKLQPAVGSVTPKMSRDVLTSQ